MTVEQMKQIEENIRKMGEKIRQMSERNGVEVDPVVDFFNTTIFKNGKNNSKDTNKKPRN
jgi:hypothetical protein